MIQSYALSLFLLICSFISNAQHFKNAPFESIGEYDGKTLYVRSFDFISSNGLNVYTIENHEFLKKMSIVTPEDYILQVFIYHDRFFLFTSDIRTETYYLIKLDDDLEEESRVKIMEKREKGVPLKDLYGSSDINFQYLYFQRDHRIGISVKRLQNRFIVADLETMNFRLYTSTLKKDSDYRVKDCLLGEKLDAIFIAVKGLESAFVVCQDENIRNMMVPAYNKKTKNTTCNFKFITDPSTGNHYAVSHYFNEHKNEQGYTLTSFPSFNIDSISLKIIPDATLHNPAIWTKNQYKKILKNKMLLYYNSYEILSAEFIRGFLIVKSQKGYPLAAENIIISRIDPDSDTPQVKWTFLSHFTFDNFVRYHTKMGYQNFISLVQNDELWIYHNIQKSHLTPEGTPNMNDHEIYLGKPDEYVSRIIKYTINLESGEFKGKLIDNSESFKGKLTNPCYQLEDGIITFTLYEINFLTKQFSDPVIVSIPID